MKNSTPKTISYQTVNMTPAVAAEILKGNDGNRSVKKNHVDFLADSMAQGEWKLSHQGVAISPTGRLLDGQHRLLAVVKSGVTVPMMVAYNVQEANFAYMDSGITRSNADSLNIHVRQADICRFICILLSGKKRKPTAKEIMVVYNAFEPALKAIPLHRKCRAQALESMSTRAAIAVLFMEGFNVVSVYIDMMDLNFENLPHNASVFTKLCIRGISRKADARLDCFLLALKALDPRVEDRKVLRNSDRADMLTRVKTIIGKGAKP